MLVSDKRDLELVGAYFDPATVFDTVMPMEGDTGRVDMTRMLGLLLLLAAGAVAADYEFESSFGSFGSAPGQFSDPRGVAVNSSGKIIVSESGNNRIQVCSDTGACSAFGSPGVLTGQFDKPRGVAVDSSGEIVIADRGNDRIQFCTETGSCDDMGRSGTGLGRFESPRGVAVLSPSQIVVADTEHHRIQICTRQGSCSAFGSLGSSPGQFDGPAGVAVNSLGRIIVTDRSNNRIQICTTTGSCTAFGSSGSGLGQFNGPTGVAVDSQDRIIIVDRFNHRIQVCTSQGDCMAFGGFGSANGQFNAPWGVGVDSQDRIIVADLGNNRIQIFSEPEVTAPVVINSFAATPGVIEAGESVSISWSVSNASECTPVGGAGNWSGKTIDPSGGNTNVTITSVGTFTFTLECSGGGTMDSSSVDVTATEAQPPFFINAGITDAWFFPVTAGQGFFIIVWEDIKTIFLAWFTYDVERPPEDVTAMLGEPGHRWITAQGHFEGDTATLDVFVSSGGVFDAETPPVETIPDGTMVIRFIGCNEGLLSYHIESLNLSGEVPIERIVLDNVPLCEALDQAAATQ